jgi:hypothetical protein
VQTYTRQWGARLQRRAGLPDWHLIGRLRGNPCHAAARERLSNSLGPSHHAALSITTSELSLASQNLLLLALAGRTVWGRSAAGSHGVTGEGFASWAEPIPVVSHQRTGPTSTYCQLSTGSAPCRTVQCSVFCSCQAVRCAIQATVAACQLAAAGSSGGKGEQEPPVS